MRTVNQEQFEARRRHVREAALACRLLQPRKVVPMHFGTFPPLTGRPDELRKLIGDGGTEVWALEPGKTVDW